MADARTVAILAGGASRRMGRDKAQLVIAGETLIARTLRVALEAECDVLVIGGSAHAVPPHSQVRFVHDDHPGEGPLAALVTALRAAPANAEILLCACDMPRLSARSFVWTFDQASRRPALDGVALQRAGQIEPLFSIYRPSCLPAADDLLSKGSRSLRALLERGNFAVISPAPWLAEQLINVNTPEEWRALLADLV